MFLEWMPRHQSIFGPVRQHERHLVAILVWNLRTWFPLIISESTWRISTKFDTDVSWVDAPTPVDFRTGPTTGAPPSGNFSLKFANLVFVDYFWKYLMGSNQISHGCYWGGCTGTSRFSDQSDNRVPPSGYFILNFADFVSDNWFPMIISESTWRISTKFYTDVSWVDAPTTVDFRTSPTTGVPPSGNFSLKFANLVSDDYFGKYLVEFNRISNRCS